jgi:membrane dipeptidase
MLLWDNHTCMPLRPGDETFLPQLQRFRESGVHVVSLNVGFGEQMPEQHFRMLAHFRRWVEQRPNEYFLVRTAEDAERALESGKLGITFDIEGARAIGNQLSLIGAYYDLGVRWVSIAYNLNNDVGGGCMDDDRGLTAFGRAFIDEMERVGMTVCVSHTGERTVRDVLHYAPARHLFALEPARAARSSAQHRR